MTKLDLAAIAEDIELAQRSGEIARHVAIDHGPQLIAEVEKLRRAAKTLGKIIEDSLTDVKNATDSDDLIGEDGDGDWMAVFERLAELRPARDAALADVERLRARETQLRELAETWRYKGEFGWGPWQTGEGPDHEGYVLDQASSAIRAVLDAEVTR